MNAPLTNRSVKTILIGLIHVLLCRHVQYYGKFSDEWILDSISKNVLFISELSFFEFFCDVFEKLLLACKYREYCVTLINSDQSSVFYSELFLFMKELSQLFELKEVKERICPTYNIAVSCGLTLHTRIVRWFYVIIVNALQEKYLSLLVCLEFEVFAIFHYLEG